MGDNDHRERLAAYAHDAWAGWMTYLFDKCAIDDAGAVTIPDAYANALRRLMSAPYSELTEAEKAGDRIEADKMIAIFEDA